MLRNLIFGDNSMEKDFILTRQSFHFFSFRNFIVSLVLQSCAIYFSNPLRLNIMEPAKLAPFLFVMILTISFYYAVTRKYVSYCSLALSTWVLFYIMGESEFVNYLKNEVQLESWVYFMLGINIQTGSVFLLVSRIRWTHCLVIISVVNFFSWIRIIDLFHNSGAQKAAIISLVANIFLLVSTAYSSEKGDRSAFEKLKLQNKQLEALEGLIKNVIPTAIIIIKEEDVLFVNEGTNKLLGILEKSELVDILSKIKVLRREKTTGQATPLESGIEVRLQDSPLTLYELIKYYENYIHIENNEQYKMFSCFELEFQKHSDELQQSFSCQIAPTLWKGSLGVVIILSDISAIKNYYKSLDIYKDNLLATVSHDLRTPLNGMLGMLELMIEETENDFLREKLCVTMSSAKLLLSMINDILDFSLITKGRLRLKFETTNVTALVEDTVNILKLQAVLKGLGLEVENYLSNREESHIIDGNRIKQVLLNLIGNAIKFTNTGRITVRIREELLEGSFDYFSNEELRLTRRQVYELPDEIRSFECSMIRKRLIFEVEDSGIGIKETDLGKLFKLFSRVGVEDGKDQNGIGLGLAISQSLVGLMNPINEGANIKVQSEYGKGSKFFFPIYVEKEPSILFKEILDLEMKLPLSFETKTFNSFNNKDLSPSHNLNSEGDSLLSPDKKLTSVLVVDDDQINILVAKSYLSSFKDEYLVFTANNGKEAVEKVLEHSRSNSFFDIILMDCNMPIMDGYEASEKIKSLIKVHFMPYTPIVAITANVGNSDKEKCLSHGMDFYLTKPYTKNQLINIIKDAAKIS